jgi:hypothetical protein
VPKNAHSLVGGVLPMEPGDMPAPPGSFPIEPRLN